MAILRRFINFIKFFSPLARIEHYKVIKMTSELVPDTFYKDEISEEKFKVLFLSPIFNSYPVLLTSLKQQTYKNWDLLFVHDGPTQDSPYKYDEIITDNNVTLVETKLRSNDWGHTPRQVGLEKISTEFEADFIVITNSDNYYVPGFIKLMLMSVKEDTQAVYCDMIHDYYSWRNFKTQLKYSYIDCGCLLVRKEAVLKVGWKKNTYEADWNFVSDLITEYGKESFVKVKAPLFVHN